MASLDIKKHVREQVRDVDGVLSHPSMSHSAMVLGRTIGLRCSRALDGRWLPVPAREMNLDCDQARVTSGRLRQGGWLYA